MSLKLTVSLVAFLSNCCLEICVELCMVLSDNSSAAICYLLLHDNTTQHTNYLWTWNCTTRDVLFVQKTNVKTTPVFVFYEFVCNTLYYNVICWSTWKSVRNRVLLLMTTSHLLFVKLTFIHHTENKNWVYLDMRNVESLTNLIK